MNSVIPRQSTVILRRLTQLSIPLLVLVLIVGWAAIGSGGCVGTGGGTGNDNVNMNGDNGANENSVNDNSSNDNSDNGNSDNDNGDVNSNGNNNANDNGADNSNDNQNDNGADNANDNGDNANDNSDGDNGNDNSPPPDPGLLATSQRSAFQSQCAQNVLECTTSWPEAVATLDISRRGADQIFGILGGGRFVVTGTDGDGSEMVPLRGDQSVIGDNATSLGFEWSHAATDADQCTLDPGPVFSTQPNPTERMQTGFHYIRLTVSNDNIRDINSDQCGQIAAQARLFDFVEFEIEVRD